MIFHRYRNVDIFFNWLNKCSKRNISTKRWNVIFFGSDNFSLESLKALKCEQLVGNVDCLEVVSNLTKRSNAVIKYAKQEKLTLHDWPLKPLTEGIFDIGVVVSFGNLIPEKVIRSFPLGIINVHGSLLPRWRGAAPVVHTLLSGDCTSGVTVMRIHPKNFDVGEIVSQSELEVARDMLQPELHDRLARLGADCLVRCVRSLPHCLHAARPQSSAHATYAPKVTPSLSHIDWGKKTATEVYNLSRALYGIQPLLTNFNNITIKLFKLDLWTDFTSEEESRLPETAGMFKYEKQKQVIRVFCKDGHSVFTDTLGVLGKKNMTALEFKNGFMKHIPKNKLLFTNLAEPMGEGSGFMI